MAGNIVKVTIEGSRPPIWRRIILPEKISFLDFHQVLQIAFGWSDDHLHDFKFPNTRFRIICNEDESRSDDERETKALVDDYLEQYNWIRYTYDFGDDWQHKIVFEKKMPDYQARYATIVKAKGNNFVEDSGGVWRNEQESDTFSVEACNEALMQWSFPVRRIGKSRKQREAGYEESLRELMKTWKELTHRVKYTNAASGAAHPSRMKKSAQQWTIFWEQRTSGKDKPGNTPSKNAAPSKTLSAKWEAEEQLSLFAETDAQSNEADAAFSNVEFAAPSQPHKQPWGIYKTETFCSMQDLLEQLSHKEAKDYCRYIQLSHRSNASRKALVSQFIEFMVQHPQYYLWVLDEDAFVMLQRLWNSRAGLVEDDVEPDAILKAMALGIIRCECKGRASGRYAELTFAKEAEGIFAALQKPARKKAHRTAKKLADRIASILMAYGVMELGELEQLYREVWDDPIDSTELKRAVYWHMSFRGDISTAMTESGWEYAAIVETDITQALEDREQYVPSLPYRAYSREALKTLQSGVNVFYPQWQAYGDFMLEFAGLTEQEVAYWIQDHYIAVVNGATVTELMDDVLEIYEPDTMQIYYDLWYLLICLVMETGLVGLKGYARCELLENAQCSAADIPDIALDGHDENGINKKTHLYEMPHEVQIELYVACTKEDSTIIGALEKLLKKCGGKNEEMLLMLAEMCGIYGDMKRAEQILKRLSKENRNDPSISQTLTMMRQMKEINDQLDIMGLDEPDFRDDPLWDEAAWNFPEPYKREASKIGRNDPCPCGSGKKYKHCCGKFH